MDRANSWKRALRALFTLWIFFSPWILVHLTMSPLPVNRIALVNSFVVGLFMMLAAVAPPTSSTAWEDRLHAAAGAWLVISPWLLGFSDDPVMTWNAALTGAAVLLLSMAPNGDEPRKSGA